MLRKFIASISYRPTISQISRRYCQVTRACWSCNATLSNSSDIFCSNCQSIQKVPNVVSDHVLDCLSYQQMCNLLSFQDYFILFGVHKKHLIDLNDLTSRFRSIQSQIHPDKFSGKTDEEQTLSSEWSSLVNKAYKTLQGPLERGEYLLGLHGVTLPEDNTMSDPEFLMEMMEKNEEVNDSSPLPTLALLWLFFH